MDYQRYRINVRTFPDPAGTTFYATYGVRDARGEVFAGTTPDGFKLIADAEREGYRFARKWIENKTR